MIDSNPQSVGLFERSSLYREFRAEREAILRHKWIESEQAGHDIGFDTALVSWTVHHRSEWQRARRQQHLPGAFGVGVAY